MESTKYRDSSELCLWLNAARRVLEEAGVPLHYSDMKRAIVQRRLVPSSISVSLEESLQYDSEHGRQLCAVPGQAGYFMLLKSDEITNIQDKKESPFKMATKLKLKSEFRRPTQTEYNNQDPANQGSEGCSLYTRYRHKYKQLKRRARDLIFLNAAYCDEIVNTEEDIVHLQQQRRYLANLLIQKETLECLHQEQQKQQLLVQKQQHITMSNNGSHSKTMGTVGSANRKQSHHSSSTNSNAACNSNIKKPPQRISHLLGEGSASNCSSSRKSSTAKKKGSKNSSVGGIGAKSARTSQNLKSSRSKKSAKTKNSSCNKSRVKTSTASKSSPAKKQLKSVVSAEAELSKVTVASDFTNIKEYSSFAVENAQQQEDLFGIPSVPQFPPAGVGGANPIMMQVSHDAMTSSVLSSSLHPITSSLPLDFLNVSSFPVEFTDTSM